MLSRMRLRLGVSCAERCSDRAVYLTQYKKAVDDLVEQRWILAEDSAALLHRGPEEWAEATR